MTPKRPKLANFTYTGYEHPDVGLIRDLPVFCAADGAMYTIWRLGFWEKLRIAFGQPVVVGILTSHLKPMTVQVGADRIPREDE